MYQRDSSFKRRNVVDSLRHLSDEELKSFLDSKRNDFSILIQNVRADANLGIICRAANAFLAKEVIFYGVKGFNRSVAVGTQNLENLKFFHDRDKLFAYLESKRYHIVCAELSKNAKPIFNVSYKDNTLFVFGNENDGIYSSLLKKAHEKVFVPQLGSVRSLNVGVTATIFMYDWISKHPMAKTAAVEHTLNNI